MDMAMGTPESVSIQRLVMDGRISKEAKAFGATPVSPARGQGDERAFSPPADLVDISGLEAIGEAIKQYRGQEALPIPETVGRAIRSMVREVLDGLPHGGGFFKF